MTTFCRLGTEATTRHNFQQQYAEGEMRMALDLQTPEIQVTKFISDEFPKACRINKFGTN